jgi:hypothetical protein
MRKLVLPTMAAFLVILLLQTAAWAGAAVQPGAPSVSATTEVRSSPWGPWVRTPYDPLTFTGLCTTDVGLTFPVDRVIARQRTDAGGNTEIESKGSLVVTLTPAGTDKHYTFDISGPSLGAHTQISYLNGDYLYRATGASILFFPGTTVNGTGMPRLAYTRGPVAILYTDGVKSDVITRPHKVIDLCARMGLGTAP